MSFADALRLRRRQAPLSANITSLVDVMLVLLLYLAFVYGTQSGIAGETRPSALPATTGGHMDTGGLHVVLTMEAVQVDNKQVMALDNGLIAKDKVSQLARMRRAVEQGLAQRMVADISEESLINRAASAGWLYLDAVHNIPYTTIEAVTRTARTAGVEHFRLIVHAKR